MLLESSVPSAPLLGAARWCNTQFGSLPRTAYCGHLTSTCDSYRRMIKNLYPHRVKGIQLMFCFYQSAAVSF